MCEPFKCHFQYNNNKYDIELSEEFSKEVSFESIFMKVKQIIDLIANKNISFDSHVFEVSFH